MKITAFVFCALGFAATTAVAADAQADPQVNAGLTLGAVASDLGTNGPNLAFAGGLRGDVLFWRQRSRDIGFGPYVDASTAGFATFEPGAGASLLVPFGEVATVLSAGGFYRFGHGDAPGGALRLFIGSREYNFGARYGLAGGLVIEGRFGLGDPKQADVVAALQLDLEYFAIPVLYVVEAIRH